MFTAEQIKAAHAKVKSGADFPAYIQEIKAMGVTHYEAYVTDGHIDYHASYKHTATTPAKYEPIAIAQKLDLDTFKAQLLAHQQGRTNYMTFITMCATCGIVKWEVCLDKMTCTYLDLENNKILVEQIPSKA